MGTIADGAGADGRHGPQTARNSKPTWSQASASGKPRFAITHRIRSPHEEPSADAESTDSVQRGAQIALAGSGRLKASRLRRRLCIPDYGFLFFSSPTPRSAVKKQIVWAKSKNDLGLSGFFLSFL